MATLAVVIRGMTMATKRDTPITSGGQNEEKKRKEVPCPLFHTYLLALAHRLDDDEAELKIPWTWSEFSKPFKFSPEEPCATI